MHELSVAQEIINIVNNYLPDNNATNVKAVKVKVGKLSNILTDSLTFCFEALTNESQLKGAKLEIVDVPVKVLCLGCNEESEIENPVFACPKCRNNKLKMISGMELQVDEIELFDEIEEVT
jgi:hydrogenase nickel incorporation protein HypA/HybF